VGLGEEVEEGFRPLSNSPTKWGCVQDSTLEPFQSSGL
jgi:hypothetical protein